MATQHRAPLLLVVVGSVAVLVLAWSAWRPGPGRCDAMGTRVEGFDGFTWANGFTGSGSEWSTALTAGVVDIRDEDRPAIATATAADDDGFDRFVGSLPEEDQAAARRLRALVADPSAAADRADDPTVEADVRAVRTAAMDVCSILV